MTRLRRVAVRASVAVVAGAVALELVLRWLIFSPASPLEFREGLRDPSFYAAPECGTEFYLVQAKMVEERFATFPCPTADPLLGWRSALVAPQTYAHAHSEEAGARRPVLFYGDSFTQCVERAGNCWETLLAESDLADRLHLLNYGVGGYGFDQACLMLRETLPAFAERDPIVVVGLLVDDDLDRCALNLRSWPKPRFRVAGDGLELEPPAGPSAADVLAERSPGITSYAWRLVLYRSGLVPDGLRRSLLGRDDAEAEVREIAVRLIDEVVATCEAGGHPLLFVLFHGPELSSRLERDSWRDAFLKAELEARDVPYVDAGAALFEVVHHTSGLTDTGDLFYLEGRGLNHLSTLGNEVVFAELARALEGLAF